LKKLIKPLKTKAKNNSTNQRQFQQHPDIGCNGQWCREACGIKARQIEISTAEHCKGISATAEKTLINPFMKLKFFAVLIAIIAASGWRTEAQTNIVPVISTNWITSSPSFREVDGQLYNIELSTNFVYFNGKVSVVLTNAIVLKRTIFGDNFIFITNFPASLHPAFMDVEAGRAMFRGTINFSNRVLQLWDYGTPHRVMVVATNYPP
jgi:hypothetical protein